MSLNNWLCKRFDTDKKGYVTIANVLLSESVVYMLVVWLVVWAVGIATSLVVGLPYTKIPPKSVYDVLFQPIVEGWYVLITILVVPLVVLVIGIYIIYKLSQIKIAKCPLKEDDKK